MKKLSKFEIIAGIVGLVVFPIVGYLLIYSPEKYSPFPIIAPSRTAGMELKKEISYIKARGDPLNLKDLASPPIPKEENAAFLYQKASDKVGKLPGEIEELLSERPSNLTLKEKIALDSFIKENEESFFLIEKAITYNRCQLPVNYEMSSYFKLSYFSDPPYVEWLRTSVRLLALKVLWELEKHNAEEAVNIAFQIKKVGDSLSNQPVFIVQFIRLSIYSVMLSSLEKILLEGDLSPVTLKRLIDVLASCQQDIKEMLKLIILGKRCIFIEAVQNPRNFLIEERGLKMGKMSYFIYSRFIKGDALYGLRIYKKMISLTELPLYEAIKESEKLEEEVRNDYRKEINKLFSKSAKISEWHFISHMLLPDIFGTFKIFAEYEAKLQEVRIVAALKLYRIKYGVYPDTLDDILLKILSPLPKDPFTGKNFIYKKEGDRFLLYSVGANLKDDGGEPEIFVNGVWKRGKDDIVWGKWDN